MQLWDTAGQERFHSLIPSYIKDCNAAVIVFDITSTWRIYSDTNSYNNLAKWIDNVREVRGEEALILILGNKKDLEEERAVDLPTAQSEFKKLGLTFMEVSAKTGSNIKEFFKDLAYMIGGSKKDKNEQKTHNPQPQQPPPQTQTQNVNLTARDHKQSG